MCLPVRLSVSVSVCASVPSKLGVTRTEQDEDWQDGDGDDAPRGLN